MGRNSLRVDLVFPIHNKELANSIAGLCIITGWQASLDEALIWAKNSGGEDPDLFLINLGPYFPDITVKAATSNKIYECLEGIRSWRKKSRIVLLCPENQSENYNLIGMLLKLHIYDFWFIDKFDETDINTFLYHVRDVAEAEEYLLDLERRKKKFLLGRNLSNVSKLQQLYRPYYLKTGILVFWTNDNSLISHASAVLTALTLAEHNCKVALIEPVSSVPQLACSLSIPHPFYNTRHALTMYAEKNNDFIRNCFFNSEQYLNDPYTPDPGIDLRYLPGGLYFLPDTLRGNYISLSQMEFMWRDFISDLIRILVVENNFSYVIFTASGSNAFNHTVLEEMAGDKFITVSMLPGSIVYGLQLRREKGAKIHLIGTKMFNILAEEIKALHEEMLIYPPECFEENFLNFIYLKNFRKIMPDTQRYINQLTEIIGLKNDSVIWGRR